MFFWNSVAFSMIQQMLAICSLVPLPFLKPGWKLEVAQSRQLFSPWNSLGQNTGVGSLSLLQGMFPTQGSNPGLSHCGQILYQPSHQGSASEDRSKTSLLESSTRLKPHEAQNYRKKALWVSWFSIIVTLALAVAAFSEYSVLLIDVVYGCCRFYSRLLWDALLLLVDCYWWVNFFSMVT